MEPPAEVATQHVAHEHAVQLDLGLAVIALAYERVVAPRVAIQIEGGIFGTWFGPAFDHANYTGFGGGLRPTVFLTEDAPRGVYVAPFVRIGRVTSDTTGSSTNWGYSTGVFAGYSWLFADHFNVRVGAGGQWLAYETYVGTRRESFKSLFPALDLVVGYAF